MPIIIDIIVIAQMGAPSNVKIADAIVDNINEQIPRNRRIVKRLNIVYLTGSLLKNLDALIGFEPIPPDSESGITTIRRQSNSLF